MNATDPAKASVGYAGLVGIVVFFVSLIVLVGWLLGNATLTGIVPGWPQMAPLTSVTMALCGGSLALFSQDARRRSTTLGQWHTATGCAMLALILALIRLCEYLLGGEIGLDSLGLQSLAAGRGWPTPVMSPTATVGFALCASALMLTHCVRCAFRYQTLSLLTSLTACLGLTRYLFPGLPLLPYTQMAIHTAIALLWLATGLLALRPDTRIFMILTNTGPAGISARRLLPAALIVPLASGWLTLAAEQSSLLGLQQAFAIFALSSVVVFTTLVWANVVLLARMDAERQDAQTALAASEERTRLTIETALDAVITMDRTGAITTWSPQAESLFGWTRSEALGRALSDTIIPERYRAQHQHGLERYLVTGEHTVLNRRIELTALRRDGSEFPVELAITPIGVGDTITFSAFVRDVTERHRAQNALQDSQQLLQSIIDNSPAVVYVKDLEGRYLLVNRRYEEIFQLKHDAILGRTDHDLFAKPAADLFRAIDVRVAATNASVVQEEVVPQVDGAHVYISVKAPLRDRAGGLRGIFGISTDITERKRAEEHLRIQAERLSLLDRTTRAIGERQDLKSIFQVATRSLEEHLPIDFGCVCLYEPTRQMLEIACIGVKSRELAIDLAMTEQARIAIDQNGLGRCVQGQLVYEPDVSGSPYPFTARIARGGLRAVVFAPITVEKKVFGILVAARCAADGFTSTDCEFLRQLSEHLALASQQAQLYGNLQRAYEDLRETQESVMQQERLRALGQMASGVAHDINNALSPAALYAQSLLESNRSLDSEAREYLNVIRRAIEDVGTTVGRMRMFARPRKPELNLAPVNLNALLPQVVELTRARWSTMPQEHGTVIDLKQELAPRLPPIMGAENEIRDALTNLVLNAVDAMPDGGTLTLRTRADAARGAATFASSAIVEISDTGIGMTEHIRKRCLEPFFTTKGERGTGLGLPMVYGMVQRHSADLQIDSEPGAGTTVRLIFAATAPIESPSVIPVDKPRPIRLLLVDDDPVLLKSLWDVLQSDGHSVTTADGGQQGIDEFLEAHARGEPFEAVITDLGMPKVDGRRVAAAIKSAAPNTSIVLLTGWGQRLRSEDELPEHVDRVLSKPPRLSELRATLTELAGRPMQLG